MLAHSLRDAATAKKLAVMVTLDSVSAEAITQLKASSRALGIARLPFARRLLLTGPHAKQTVLRLHHPGSPHQERVAGQPLSDEPARPALGLHQDQPVEADAVPQDRLHRRRRRRLPRPGRALRHSPRLLGRTRHRLARPLQLGRHGADAQHGRLLRPHGHGRPRHLVRRRRPGPLEHAFQEYLQPALLHVQRHALGPLPVRPRLPAPPVEHQHGPLHRLRKALDPRERRDHRQLALRRDGRPLVGRLRPPLPEGCKCWLPVRHHGLDETTRLLLLCADSCTHRVSGPIAISGTGPVLCQGRIPAQNFLYRPDRRTPPESRRHFFTWSAL